MPQINTSSGGLVETVLYRDRLQGEKLYLHIDQSTNVNNGEGDAAIHLTNKEVKELIAVLNDYIIYTEGKPYVLLADPLLHPEVKIMIGDKEVVKKPENVNPYLSIESVITPGERGIDHDDYFNSILPRLNKL